MYDSVLCVIVNSWPLSSYTHTFPFLSSTVSDYSNLLSSSGENNLAALARGRCRPRLDVMALSQLQLLASLWDFLTCHHCIWQMRVQMLLWNTVSPFGHLFFFWSLTIGSLPFCPSTSSCSLSLVRDAAFTAHLQCLNTTLDEFAPESSLSSVHGSNGCNSAHLEEAGWLGADKDSWKMELLPVFDSCCGSSYNLPVL